MPLIPRTTDAPELGDLFCLLCTACFPWTHAKENQHSSFLLGVSLLQACKTNPPVDEQQHACWLTPIVLPKAHLILRVNAWFSLSRGSRWWFTNYVTKLEIVWVPFVTLNAPSWSMCIGFQDMRNSILLGLQALMTHHLCPLMLALKYYWWNICALWNGCCRLGKLLRELSTTCVTRMNIAARNIPWPLLPFTEDAFYAWTKQYNILFTSTLYRSHCTRMSIFNKDQSYVTIIKCIISTDISIIDFLLSQCLLCGTLLNVLSTHLNENS